ncbi:MAG TPA: thioester domain-containing protein [Solirubrobacteraceae bacterium]|nr:thioester domain-containing protein [Solirubrobacteraceae bacterium]
MSGTGAGQAVQGFIANSDNTLNPATDPYPTSNPSTSPGSGWSVKNEGFAGIIHGTPVGGGATLNLYCIDINTLTREGFGYVLGTWDSANVPNVGYVARILNDYYPNTNQPSSLTNLNQRAAAVQAAIWFFSDRYVLNTSDSLRSAVVAIVNDVKAKGPLVEPPPPSLTITPTIDSAPAGHLVGPFTVTSTATRRDRVERRRARAGSITVTATGANMFANADGTGPIANGASVPSGQKIWLQSTGPSSAVLQGTASAIVPTGNVYLYDGNTAGVNDAQKLILAQTATLTTTVSATAQFLAPGSLVVTKTIAGEAAKLRGEVVIHVACSDGVDRPDFTIPASAPAGSSSQTYDNIPAGTRCLVSETANGSNDQATVVVSGDGQTVTIPTGGKATVGITNTYFYVPGSLLVRKTISGPGAGQQGVVTVHTVCDGTALSPDFTIPAGAPAKDYTQQYDNIPIPASGSASCTLTETADGSNSTVSVVTVGSGQTASIPPGQIVEADITDAYGLRPGQLLVTKTITGPQAGNQGEVVIRTVCNGTAQTPDLILPPGTAAGDYSQLYSGIAAGSTCTVTETSDGATSTVTASVIGNPQSVTIPAGGAGAAHITDSYGAAPGSLLVIKTITGPDAGAQGPVTIQAACNGTALPDFVIPAGTKAGNVSQSYDDIPAGSACSITEIDDGGTSSTYAVVTGGEQTVTVGAGRVVPVNVTDVYTRSEVAAEVEDRTGELRVTKTIAGPAAGHEGRIAILVACGAPRVYAFIIPAHTRAGSISRAFADLPAGTHCTITEVVNGHTGTVTVATTGRRQTAVMAAGREATVRLSDRYSAKAKAAVTPKFTG